MRRRVIYASGVFVVGILMLLIRAAEAQTTAVGPYYAIPSWDQTFSCTTPANCPRFVVLSNFNSEAVLDRETGLVWERSPSTELLTWRGGHNRCNEFLTIGNRRGWRLPTLQELTSLVDPSRSNPALPAGHPFNNVQLTDYYFTATTDSRNSDNKFVLRFSDGDSANGITGNKDGFHFVWCVRGGSGIESQ
jgi:hypothetical protein